MSETAFASPIAPEAPQNPGRPDGSMSAVPEGFTAEELANPVRFATEPSPVPAETAEPNEEKRLSDAFYRLDETRKQFENGEANERAYRQQVKGVAGLATSENAVDMIANATVNARRHLDELRAQYPPGTEPSIPDRRDFEKTLRQLLGGKDVVKAMPKRLQRLFARKVKKYERKGVEGAVSPDRGSGGGEAATSGILSGEGSTEPLASNDSAPQERSLVGRVLQRSAEIIAKHPGTAKAIGLAAMASAGVLIAKGIITAEHAQVISGGVGGNIDAARAQLDAFVQPAHQPGIVDQASQHAAAATHAPAHPHITAKHAPTHETATTVLAPWGNNGERVVPAGAIGVSIIVLGGLTKHVLKVRGEKRAHNHEHAMEAKEAAEELAIEAMVSRHIAGNGQTIEELRHSDLTAEFTAQGKGPTGVTHSTNVVGHFVNIMREQLSGDAVAVDKYLKNLLGGKDGAEKLGIDLKHLSLSDRMTLAGSVIDVKISDSNALNLAKHLALEEEKAIDAATGLPKKDKKGNEIIIEHLGLGDLIANPIGDAVTMSLIDQIKAKQDILDGVGGVRVFSNQYAVSGIGQTPSQIQHAIHGLLNELVREIGLKAPNSDVLEKNMKAMGLEGYLRLIPDSVTQPIYQEVPEYEKDGSGQIKRDNFGRPIPVLILTPGTPLIGGNGMPIPAPGNTVIYIPDPAHPGSLMIDPANRGNDDYLIDPTSTVPVLDLHNNVIPLTRRVLVGTKRVRVNNGRKVYAVKATNSKDLDLARRLVALAE